MPLPYFERTFLNADKQHSYLDHPLVFGFLLSAEDVFFQDQLLHKYKAGYIVPAVLQQTHTQP